MNDDHVGFFILVEKYGNWRSALEMYLDGKLPPEDHKIADQYADSRKLLVVALERHTKALRETADKLSG